MQKQAAVTRLEAIRVLAELDTVEMDSIAAVNKVLNLSLGDTPIVFFFYLSTDVNNISDAICNSESTSTTI